MHAKYKQADKLSGIALDAAFEVHRIKGAGLLEPLYQKWLSYELTLRGVHCEREKKVPIEYKGHIFDENLRFDILAEDCLLIETKSVEKIVSAHIAQLLSYMKLLDIPIGLIINFHEPMLKNGIRRLILKGADQN